MVFQYIYHSTLAFSISKTRMRILFYSALVVDNHCKLSWYSVISGHTVLKGFLRGSEPLLSAISNLVISTTQGWPSYLQGARNPSLNPQNLDSPITGWFVQCRNV